MNIYELFWKFLGVCLYACLKNVNLRFLLPDKYVGYIEKLRTNALVMQGATIGPGSLVRNSVFVAYPKNLTLGENVTLGAFSRIYNYSLLVIGDDTEIGPGLHVQNNDHVWFDIEAPLGKQGCVTDRVRIGRGVFIGANVTILKGVNVEDFNVVAAGAVVTKSLESGYLHGGVPAKKIRPLEQVIN